uniref:ubiquitinyl hydrolase 1 n=1 Tax=Piliocolobus tephrosceles TaxID=591936 RepID=A0A8C9LGQ7_9PRIM
MNNIGYLFEQGGNRGLINLGNTCFLNSSLQCLSKILKFSNYFLSGTFWQHINYHNPVGQHGRLAKAYYETLQELWKVNKKQEPYTPRILKQAICEKWDELYGYHQHDSQELLAFLLDGLHEDLNLVKNKPYYEDKLQGGIDKSDTEVAEASWNRHKEINNSIIVDLFQGQYRSKLQCPYCKKVSITFDPFMYLSVPLPPNKTHRIWFHVLLSNNLPIVIRFSCTFPGSQQVSKLKLFLLNIIKNLKKKRKKIILHSKNLIKNNSNKQYHTNEESTNAFNFHVNFMEDIDEYDNDDNEEDDNGMGKETVLLTLNGGMNNKDVGDVKNEECIGSDTLYDDAGTNSNGNTAQDNSDIKNYVKIMKNKKEVTSILSEKEIEQIEINICNMCNITTINELKTSNLFFMHTKLKNLSCDNLFQVVNNNDMIIEPHTRIGKGISHIFVFLLPQSYTHLVDEDIKIETDGIEADVMDEGEKICSEIVTPNSDILSNGINFDINDKNMNIINKSNNSNKTMTGSEDVNMSKKKQHLSKTSKKRKGIILSDTNVCKKDDKVAYTEDSIIESEEGGDGDGDGDGGGDGGGGSGSGSGTDFGIGSCADTGASSNSNNITSNFSHIDNSNQINNGLYNSNIENMSNNSCLKSEINIPFKNGMFNSIEGYPNTNLNGNNQMNSSGSINTDRQFSIMVIPICKDDQSIYKMRNNDVPLLLHVSSDVTLEQLYNQVGYAYGRCGSMKKKIHKDMVSDVNTTLNGINKTNHHQISNIGNCNKIDYENSIGINSNINDGISTHNNNNSVTKINENCNLDKTNKLVKKDDNINISKDTTVVISHPYELNNFKLFLSWYYTNEDSSLYKNNLGLELPITNTYLTNYIKNIEEQQKKLIIVYFNSNNISEELSLDIKTLTFVELEEVYGIDTCLKLFSEEERLDEQNTWYCSHCKLHVQAYKKLDLFRMPSIL